MDAVIRTLSCLIAQAQYLHEVEMLLFGRLDFQLGRAAPIVGLWCAYRAFSHWGKVGGKAEAFSIAQKAVHVYCRIGIRSVAHAETMLLHITGTMLLRQVQTHQSRYGILIARKLRLLRVLAMQTHQWCDSQRQREASWWSSPHPQSESSSCVAVRKQLPMVMTMLPNRMRMMMEKT